MRALEKTLDYPKLIILGAVLFCILGAIAAFELPKERAPRIKLPVVIVAVPNPGAPPASNESQIVRKIEEQAGSLKGLRSEGGIHSQALNGAAVVMFVFEDKVKVKDAKADVESLINRIKGTFPPEAQQNPGPTINDIGFEDFPIVQVFIAGGVDGKHRRKVAERLQKRIEKIQGVAGVDVFGGLEEEVQIEVDPHRMAIYGFNYQQIEGSIRRQNTEAPSGAIQSASGSDQRVRVPSRLASLNDIAAVPVGVKDGKPILLSDIARVSMGHKPIETMARYGGEDAVVLLVRPRTDIDVLLAATNVQDLVDNFVASSANEGTHIGTVRSQSREIHYMLDQLGSNAWQGTLLVVIMLWISFGWRNATLISLAFPFCLLVTAGLMWLAKKTFLPDIAINNMVLFALIMVVGEVADGSIVVGENIYRHMEMGKSRLQAAKEGMAEVAVPVFFAYLTTCASFAPLFVVRGVMGEFLRLLPIVTFFALAAAILVDHFLLPVLSIYFMKGPKNRSATARPGMSQDEAEIADLERLTQATRFRRVYCGLLTAMIPHRALILTLAAAVVLVPLGLFAAGLVGFELFSEADVPFVEVSFELPLGSSMEKRTAEVAAQLEAATLRAVKPEEWFKPSETASRVKPVTTIGNAGVLTTRIDSPTPAGAEFGMVYVELELAENRKRSAAEIRAAIEKELPPLPGVIVRVTSPKEGPPAGAPVVLRLLAQRETTLEDLAARAAKIEEILRATPGARDVTSDYRVRPEIVATPNRAIASLFGIDAAQIATSVNYALDGVRVGAVDFGGDDEIDLRLRNLPGTRDQVADLADLPLRSAGGKVVSLDQVAEVDRAMSPHTIQHYDGKRAINIRANLESAYLPDDIKASMLSVLRPDLTPVERRAIMNDHTSRVLFSDDTAVIEFGGENQIRDEAFVDLNVALALALAGNFILFVIQFNNFRQPTIILASVPISLVGVALGLLMAGMHFSVMAMIGVVAVSGVIVDNAMVIVEFSNKMRAAGIPLDKAVVYATQLRTRPIILTTLSNVVGMLPTALNLGGGGELWQPLAIAVMGGLGFGTLVQLLIVPLLYHAFGDIAPKQGSSNKDSQAQSTEEIEVNLNEPPREPTAPQTAG